MAKEEKTKEERLAEKAEKEAPVEEIKFPDLPSPTPLQSKNIRLENITNLFEAHSEAPTHNPRTFYEQFYLYKSGTTYRLYVYVDDAWKYVDLS